jgi:tRNA-splicing ligase RtcB
MEYACQLPIAVRGALMSDAHVGYGLPIGGVLATEGAVIPYAVGVDIACRMKISVLDIPVNAIVGQTDRLVDAIESETRFGVGASFREPREHPVMDDDWSVSEVTMRHKSKAWSQLGTSGSGNHFVEFGPLNVESIEAAAALGLDGPGEYLALLSHSGSRGVGAQVAAHYSRIAMNLHPELPKELRHLAWLDIESPEGQAYWNAMELMGRYAAANHAMIHHHIARHLKAEVLADVENHHNFAWEGTASHAGWRHA